MNREVLVTCLFSLILLTGSVPVSAEAASWLPPSNTDVCWGAGGSIMHLRFLNVGGGYYQVAGKMTESGGVIGAIFGSAVTTSTAILVTATWSGANSSSIWTETGRITINRTTLKLTGYGAGLDHDKSSPDPESASPYFGGPHIFKKIQCP